jgi:feruloyl esterase
MTSHPSGRAVRDTIAGRVSAAALLLVLGGCGTTPEPAPRSRCEGLRGRTFEEARITGAELIAASGPLPEYCKVTGTLPPSLDFEVRLPSAWNEKTVYAGGGGFDGFIPDTGVYTAKGYASIGSNGGHTGDVLDASFALDAQKLDDFAYRSIHRVLPIAKALIQERYGKSATKTWFEGCSNGGREALIEAQRWPEDFDGIIARAPAYNFVELLIAFNRNTRQLMKPGANLSAGKLQVLGKAVLDACDAKDGVADGIISHPSACTFDPSVLRRRAGGLSDGRAGGLGQDDLLPHGPRWRDPQSGMAPRRRGGPGRLGLMDHRQWQRDGLGGRPLRERNDQVLHHPGPELRPTDLRSQRLAPTDQRDVGPGVCQQP